MAGSRAPPGQGGRGMQCRVLLVVVVVVVILRLLFVRACLFSLVSAQSNPVLLQLRCQLRQAWPGHAGCM